MESKLQTFHKANINVRTYLYVYPLYDTKVLTHGQMVQYRYDCLLNRLMDLYLKQREDIMAFNRLTIMPYKESN